MNDRIKSAFERGKAFVGFITGGDPSIDKTYEFVLEMVRGGADVVEIGIPFSDPVAEGPTIQAASTRALAGGITVDALLGLVRALRREVRVPILFMTYLNPVLHYGYERFFDACREAGVDGIIVPDLPYEEQSELIGIANARGVDVVTLIAPTSSARIEMLAAHAQGFVYAVSSLGVTGVRGELSGTLPGLIGAIKRHAHVPVAVGFGIGTPDQAREVAAYADGVIVGSAIVRLVERHGDQAGPHIGQYVRAMKDAISGA